MRKFLSLAMAFVIAAFITAAVFFYTANREPEIQLDFVFAKSMALPPGLMVMISCTLGLVLGLFTAAVVALKGFMVRRRLTSELKDLRKELDEFRLLPVDVAEPAGFTAPPQMEMPLASGAGLRKGA